MLRFDAKLPGLLPAPSMLQISKGLSRFPPPRQSQQMCNGVKKLSVLLENQVSTWVSVTAKGEDIAKYVDLRGPVPGVGGLQPVCPLIDQQEVSPILGLDHLPVFALSDQFLFYKPEKALTDVSLANICHQAGLLHSALIVAGTALSASPNLVAIHFTIANIYASMANHLRYKIRTFRVLQEGDYQRALEFYYSTLSLQMNFEPAKDRIRAIYCHSGQTFDLREV
uniref:TPR_REGION domain-containing protein n=1 Tax=Angiostrongylus cantonensis TaxID=6313 RepID=A0A158P676_ANGCA